MKLMKRLSCLVMATVMTLLLCVSAFAVTAFESPQKMAIDGVEVKAQAYNIMSNNYFKLRDMACLLNGTRVQFDVGWDAANNAVSITSGTPYQKQAGDLTMAEKKGEIKEAVPSVQTLYINGTKNTSIKAYNIDGNNYFKLRDLGEALDFEVEFNSARNMILVTTVKNEPDITFVTLDMNGDRWTEDCFRHSKLTMLNYWAYWCGPCVGELPDLEKLSKDYASRGLQVIGLYDQEDEKEDKAKVKELGVTYPNLRYTVDFDPWMNTGYIPVTIFVNSDGKVVGEVYIGSQTYKEWAAIVDSLLA